MSCQQASRIITTPSTFVATEDPYVFTEAVPTTPPILFNAQKTRCRTIEAPFATQSLTTHPAVSKNFPKQKLPLTQVNGIANTIRTQASLDTTAKSNTIVVGPTVNATNIIFKNGMQSQKSQLQKMQTQQPLQNNVPSVCFPPASLQHTPSLWQTPLLLDTASPLPPPTISKFAPASVGSGRISSQPVGSVGKAMAVPPLTDTLPPSNFHHTTLAQHLQKVQYIKEPRKNSVALTTTQTIKNVPPSQHSEADLNDIPVNVIFRGVQCEGDNAGNLLKNAGCEKETNNLNSALSPHRSISQAPIPTTNKLKHLKVSASASKSANFSTHLQKLTPASDSQKHSVFVQPNTSHGTLENKRVMSSTPSMLLHQQKLSDCKSDIGTSSLKSFFSTDLNEATNLNFSTINPTINVPNGTTVLPKSNNRQKPTISRVKRSNLVSQKRSRKLKFSNVSVSKTGHYKTANSVSKNIAAVAVVKITAAQVDADINVLSDSSVLPYCLQQQWLPTISVQNAAFVDREEKIMQHKNVLRRQALQLYATRSLQRLPLHSARQRLICVDRLLRKYKNHNKEKDIPSKKCIEPTCTNRALELASHCIFHITNNAAQHIFLPCSARLTDNIECRIPVFDITHNTPLCDQHANMPDICNRNEVSYQSPAKYLLETEPSSLHFSSKNQEMCEIQSVSYKKYSNISMALMEPRKRKNSTNTASIGRQQKCMKKKEFISSPPPLSAVSQRKSSTTSLESIASNSHSSSSQALYSLMPPALAPLSGVQSTGSITNNSSIESEAQEINQIVSQFAVATNNSLTHQSDSSYSNIHFLNTNSNSNFTSGLGSSSSLPSTDELLTQDMLNICENSSAYASSEDTGFGGLSETELMTGQEVDDIPLGDTRLLEEHDLANVLSTLSADAFNELFTAVRQDERDEVERALELADKNLKTLQQTIGSDSDFLGDFLDVNDEILADTNICSKMEIVTSDLDSSALFLNSESDSAIETTEKRENSSTVANVRGLLQT